MKKNIIFRTCLESRSRDAAQGKSGRKSGAYTEYVSILRTLLTPRCALQRDYKQVLAGLWLSSMVLAGCSIEPPYLIMPPPTIMPVHINDRYGSVAPLVTYFRHMVTLTPELLNKEAVRAEQAFKEKRGVIERIKLAMLLGMLAPQEKRDEARAIRLLDGYINNNTLANETLRDYAYALRHLLIKQQEAGERENTVKERYNVIEADHKTLKERYNTLDVDHKNLKERYLVMETKLREEIVRNGDLQLKLDTLKAIEESIRRRTK